MAKKINIGKKHITIQDYDSLSKGSIVIPRSKNSRSYIVEIIEIKKNRGTCYPGHNCGGFFSSNIGYNVPASHLEEIEEVIEEEIIETNLDDICSAMPWEIKK